MTNPMREAREDLGLTREQIAAKLGCSLWTVARHEQNPARTRGHWLLALKQLRVSEVVNGG